MRPPLATPRVGRSSSSRTMRRRCSGNTKPTARGSPTRATPACSTPPSSSCRSQASRATWSVTPSPTRRKVGARRVTDWAVPYWLVDTSFATMLLLLGLAQEGLGSLFFALQKPAGPLLEALGVPDGWEASRRRRHRLAEPRRQAVYLRRQAPQAPGRGGAPGSLGPALTLLASRLRRPSWLGRSWLGRSWLRSWLWRSGHSCGGRALPGSNRVLEQRCARPHASVDIQRDDLSTDGAGLGLPERPGAASQHVHPCRGRNEPFQRGLCPRCPSCGCDNQRVAHGQRSLLRGPERGQGDQRGKPWAEVVFGSGPRNGARRLRPPASELTDVDPAPLLGCAGRATREHPCSSARALPEGEQLTSTAWTSVLPPWSRRRRHRRRDEGRPDQPDRWPLPSPRSHPPGLCLARQAGAGRPASDRARRWKPNPPTPPPCRRRSPTSFPQRSASASTWATSVSASTSSRPGLAKCPMCLSPSSKRECSKPDGRCNTEALASSRKATAPRPNSAPRRGTSRWGPAGPVLLALLACGVCRLGGWRGTDWAAQVYRAGQASHWALAIWDPGWYGGTYPLNYSLVYPLVAGYLGLWPVAALSAAGAAFCFDRLTFRHFGRRPAGSWYFALSTVIEVAIGQLPTLAGEAIALGSVLCLVHYQDARSEGGGRGHGGGGGRGGGGGEGAVSGRGVPAGGICPGRTGRAHVSGRRCVLGRGTRGVVPVRSRPRSHSTVEHGATGGRIYLRRHCRSPASFPWPWLFPLRLWGPRGNPCDLRSAGLPARRELEASKGRRGPICSRQHRHLPRTDTRGRQRHPAGRLHRRAASHLLPARGGPPPGARAEPGGRMPRWTATVLPAAVAASLVAWHWSPGLEALDAATNGPSSTAAYYEPLIAELASLSRHGPVRVEIPPTAHHWESAYVAPKFDLARGWERQLDIAYDPLFYQAGPLTPSEYRTWLLANGVSFVALADAPLDYAATAEARLLRSGEVKGLQAVWHTASWQLWRVIGSRGARNCPRYRRLAEPSLGGRSLRAPRRQHAPAAMVALLVARRPRRSRSVPAPGGGWLDRARFLGRRAAPAQHVASRRRPWQLSRPGRRTIGPERSMTDA